MWCMERQILEMKDFQEKGELAIGNQKQFFSLQQ